MSRRAKFPQSRHHVMIYDEDWDWLSTMFGAQNGNGTGAGTVIRELVHRQVARLREASAQREAELAGLDQAPAASQGAE